MNSESRSKQTKVQCRIHLSRRIFLCDAHSHPPEDIFCYLEIKPLDAVGVQLLRTTMASLENALCSLGISTPVDQLPRYPVTFDGYLPDFDSLVGTDWPRDVLQKLYPDHADFWS